MKNIIRQILKEELLNERAGISEIVRKWVKIIKEVVNEEQEAYRSQQTSKKETKDSKYDDPFYWEDEKYSAYGKKETTYEPYSYSFQRYEPLNEVIIHGDEFPEVYEEFPVDIWVIKNSNRIEYDHYNSGYEEGLYVVYLNMPISFISESALNHEVKHAYDDWNRIKSGGKPIKDTWEIKNIYTKDFEKLILGGRGKFPQLSNVIHNYYMASKLETPAYLETDYDRGGIDYKNVGLSLKDFNIKNFFKKDGRPASGLEKEFAELQKYDIPLFKKFNNVVDFLNWTKKYFNKRGDDIFRRVTKMRYVHNIPEMPKWQPVKQEYTPREQPKQEFKKEEIIDDEESTEEIAGWKFDKNKGWYYDPNEDDVNSDYF